MAAETRFQLTAQQDPERYARARRSSAQQPDSEAAWRSYQELARQGRHGRPVRRRDEPHGSDDPLSRLTLAHPFMPGASPLVDDLDTVLRLEDAGAAAIVMHSLFEEQIARERYGQNTRRPSTGRPRPSPTSRGGDYALGPDRYLEQLRRSRARGLPVIGSLNGTTAEGWLEYARLIEQAGARRAGAELLPRRHRPARRRRPPSSAASSTSSRC